MNDNAGISKHFIRPYKSSFIHSDETEVLNNDRNAHSILNGLRKPRCNRDFLAMMLGR